MTFKIRLHLETSTTNFGSESSKRLFFWCQSGLPVENEAFLFSCNFVKISNSSGYVDYLKLNTISFRTMKKSRVMSKWVQRNINRSQGISRLIGVWVGSTVPCQRKIFEFFNPNKNIITEDEYYGTFNKNFNMRHLNYSSDIEWLIFVHYRLLRFSDLNQARTEDYRKHSKD